MAVLRTSALLCLSALTIAGCKQDTSSQPDDYAQRIGVQQAPASSVTQANPAEVASEKAAAENAGAIRSQQVSASANKGPYADLVVPPSVQLDAKAAAPCKALAMSKFLGHADSPKLRQDIQAANTADGGTRFLTPGSVVNAGEKPNRLNVMLDNTGVARDFRCG